MKNSPWIIGLICIGTISGHIIISQQTRIQQLEVSSDLADKAREIDNDQIRDLLYSVHKLQTEQESVKTQSYVSGVVATLENKERIQQIWHDGYDRGAEVQLATYKIEKRERDDKLVRQLKKDLNIVNPLEDVKK